MKYVVGHFDSNNPFYAGADAYFSTNSFEFTSISFNNHYNVNENSFVLVKGYGKYDVNYSLEGEKTRNILVIVGDKRSGGSVYDLGEKVNQFKNVNAQVILYVPPDLRPTNIPDTIKVVSSVDELSSVTQVISSVLH